MKSVNRIGALVVLLPVCAGCAPTAKIESTKAVDYYKTPQSILAFLPTSFTSVTSKGVVLSGPAEAHMGEGFNEVFLPFAAKCNVTAHTNLEYKKDGKLPPPEALIALNKPDWIMTVEPTQVQTVQQAMYGVPMGIPEVTGITYNVTVMDQADHRKVWRANVKVPMAQNWMTSGDDKQPGRNAATVMINQMQADGLLIPCPALPK